MPAGGVVWMEQVANTASLQLAAPDLGLEQVETLCADLVAAGMIDRMRLQ